MGTMGFGAAAGLNMLPLSTGAMNARCTTESSGVSSTTLSKYAVVKASTLYECNECHLSALRLCHAFHTA